MEDNQQFVSQDKLDSLKKELKELREIKIPLIAKRIDDARQMGDLSENAEYHAARDEMAWVQSRVKEIENILSNVVLVDTQSGKKGVINVGSKVKVRFKDNVKEYSIVGAQEADPLSGKISNESPLGGALMGKKKGDKVEVEIPAGLQEYEILTVD